MSERSEFSFLTDDALAVGRREPLPVVRRVQLSDAVSAICWGASPATVLLLHGVALNAHTWDATVLAWPQPNVSFLAVDLPGHGDSPWRADADYSPAVLADEITEAVRAAITDGLVVENPILVGQSLGGLVGIELIHAGLVRVNQLVLVDILPLPPQAARMVAEFLDGPTSFDSREQIVQRALAFGLGGSREALERGVFLNTRLTADGRVIWKHHFGQLGGAGLRLDDPEGLWAGIAGSATPIELVLATQSIVDESLRDRFAVLRPSARIVQLGGGHNLQEDNPTELANAVHSLTHRDPSAR